MQCLNWENRVKWIIGLSKNYSDPLHSTIYIDMTTLFCIWVPIIMSRYLIILYINCRGEIRLYYFLSYK